MKHLKSFNQLNEENIFKRLFNGSNENLVSKACKDLGLGYRKNDDDDFHIVGKNGHEISVKFIESQIEDSINNVTPPLEKTAIIVRPSYYGTFYEAEKEVSDLKEYLSNYDFNSKPDILHKYNYEFKNKFNENFNQDELLTESIIGKIFDRLGYTDEVLRASIKDTLNVDENSSKEEVIQKTKDLFKGTDSKRKLLRLAKSLGVLGEIITSLVISFNIHWNNWTWFGAFIYIVLSHRENNLIRKPLKDIRRNNEFFNDEDRKFENKTDLPFRTSSQRV